MTEQVRRVLQALFWLGVLVVMGLSLERGSYYTLAKGLTTGLLGVLSVLPWQDVRRSRLKLGIAAGLFLSCLGDVAIDFLFLAGLVVFLLAHLAYIGGMGRQALWSAPQLEGAGLALLFVLGVYVGGLRPILPDEMLVPVLCYMTAIGTMVARATGLFLSARDNRSYQMLIVGAWLFGSSDALLALARWGEREAWMSPTILLLYYAGQYGFYLSSRRAQDA